MKILDFATNQPVFTTTHVVKDKAPVTCFSIDDDGDLQAFSDHESIIEDSMIISLGELLSIDPSLTMIEDLHKGAEYNKDLYSNSWVKTD